MKPIAEAVLEGLIHNLRTPLNLVLAYAQKLPDDHGYVQRIYAAGIKMDDLLQNTWEALQLRHSDQVPTELNSWLKGELNLLHCVLPIKHRFMLSAEYCDTEILAETSPRQLADKLERKLEQLMGMEGITDITLSVNPEGLFLTCNGQREMIWQ